MSTSIYDISARRIDGRESTLKEYSGKVLLIVNVASKCGLTPQYDGLEKLYERYHEQGLEILGFPANEFAGQEPGSNADIQEFCRSQFGVKFPMFEKIVVKGPGQHPLYQHLTKAQPEAKQKADSKLRKALQEKGLLQGGEHDISWNFEKFLVNRQGRVVARFAPDIVPDDAQLKEAIENELG